MNSDDVYQNFIASFPSFYKFWEKAKSAQDMETIDYDEVRAILRLYYDKIDPYQALAMREPLEMLRSMRIRHEGQKFTDICQDIADFCTWINRYCEQYGHPDRITLH